MMTNFANGEPGLGPDDLRLRVSIRMERGDGRVLIDMEVDQRIPYLFREHLYPNPEKEIVTLINNSLVNHIKGAVETELESMEMELPFSRLDRPREKASWPSDDTENKQLRELGEHMLYNGALESW